MINKIRNSVRDNLDVHRRFIFHGIRNQNEEFLGKIVAMYPAVFLITLENGSVRSYSYSDLLISNLQIID